VRFPRLIVLIVVFTILALGEVSAQRNEPSRLSPLLLAAKSVYFDNQTGTPKVGEKALERLKKWGRFQIAQDRRRADLILLLSADPYKGGYLVFADGTTGTIDKTGKIDEEPTPYYNRAAPVRYAYLTVIDPHTGEKLWSEDARWGGLLTGFNSVGERLIAALQKQMKR
jgi:hypothetical protein